MRESVIDVLFYLFDDILTQEQLEQAGPQAYADSLYEAGFSRENIGRAMDWFYAFGCISERTLSVGDDSIRIFSAEEAGLINAEGQEFLFGLLHNGILDGELFAVVVERALALEEVLDLETLRWVVQMVLLNARQEGDPLHETWREQWLYVEEAGMAQ